MTGGDAAYAAPVRVLSKLITVVWVLAGLALVAGFVAYTPVARKYASDHLYVVDNKQAITVTTSSGEALSLGVRMPSAVSGLWASPDGMTLTFTGQQPIILMQPKPQTWGDEIRTNRRDISDDKTATGRYFVPEVTAPTVLDGKITGTVVHPVGGLGTFRNEQTIIDVPVKLTVEPSGAGQASGNRLTQLVYGMLAATGVLILFALGAIVRALFRHGFKHASSAIITFVVIAAAFVGIGYLAEKAAVPDVSDVDVLGALPLTPLQFLTCVAVAIFLSMLALLLSGAGEDEPPAPAAEA
ncbi:hypothetical protein Aph02nite_64950 [Actinoplanes philippinensis]|uniref:Uncharacterized protein n=1 Tax=Actinoplanes philippinensis TaxID=35752 RepID=A0A1I2LJN3_9ACTN|nr:hypothetical protein Aph02nite_64950 [Actinoplanes philippinensis]SFF77266.1 hypothetical protein SAMN05421541_12180 [Actinoplanes philippinensis]